MNTFEIPFTITNKNSKTLFRYRYLKIPVDISKELVKIDDRHLAKKYKFEIDNQGNLFKDDSILPLLNDLENEELYLEIKHPKHKSGYYYRVLVSVPFLFFLKRLFISSLVYKAENKKIPQLEAFSLRFDIDSCKASITNVSTYTPDNNPYYDYIRNSISYLPLIIPSKKSKQQKRVTNFYDYHHMSKWQKSECLEKDNEEMTLPGIYMLFDANSKTLYVGKANNIKARLLGHKKDSDDPIPNFTHFRYSVINNEYFDYIYLLENSAIHDVAWLIDMPKSHSFSHSLSLLCKKLGINITELKMVNSVDKQTK